MSEEMNLYKRCKNIFKAHGVDMGGGGGSDGGTLMVTLTPNASYTSGVADKRISEIYNAISSGKNVVLKLLFSGTAIYFPLTMAFPAEVGFGPYVPTEEGSACQISATYNVTRDEDEWTMSL